ncbi:MAG: CPBP family intramembrane metalloprotease [Candidatus Omnitrophica bacterium]|nr:CPBP family intramembrane metalloprotease [Candidatus Omnitrophota bacterium]
MDFIKKNRLYIILFLFLVALNLLPHTAKEKPADLKEHGYKASEDTLPRAESFFAGFNEVKKRSAKIERTLKNNFPEYVFYTSLNLLIIFMFFAGLGIDGYFIFNKYKKRDILGRTSSCVPAPWNIGDALKIIILALSGSYAFFIFMDIFAKMLESVTNIKIDFYGNGNFKMIVDTIILDFFVLLFILLFLRSGYKKNITSLGIDGKNTAKNVWYGICAYIGVMPLIFAIGILVYIVLQAMNLKPPPQPIVGLFLAEKNTALILVSSVIAAVVGPVIEEIFFRGVLYNAVKSKLGVFWAIFSTSMLFSFLHTHAATYFIVGFLPITILGIVLAYLYEKTASLVPSITLHVMNNLGSVLMVFIFKYFNTLTT